MSLRVTRANRVLALMLCAGVLAGCSGTTGGSSTFARSPSAALTVRAVRPSAAHVVFAIAFTPKAKAAKITPKYVSPSTASLQILTDGSNPVVVNLTASPPNCSPNPAIAGSYICRAIVDVAPGDHVFTVTTYDASNAGGSVLSTNTTGTVYVKPNDVTTVSIVLEGVVRYAIILLATLNPPTGKAAAIGLTAILEDADQNLIVGPAPYKYPVTLTTTDSTDGPISKTVLKSPADTANVAVNYTGAAVTRISYAAAASGMADADVFGAVLTPGAPNEPRHLYVLTSGSNAVQVVDLANPSAVPATITGGGITYPSGLAADSSGKLYVAHTGADSISVFDGAYPYGALPPIPAPVAGSGLTIDASGKLYLADFVNHRVFVIDTAHGNASLPTISGGGLLNPLYLAVDASGKLYVSNENITDCVVVFDTAHGNAVLPPICGGGLNNPHGLAVGPNGKLYVANFAESGTAQSVSVFDIAHGNAALPQIFGNGLAAPEGLAVDSSGKLYVENFLGSDPNFPYTSTISVFDTAHGNAALPPITGLAIQGPLELAVH